MRNIVKLFVHIEGTGAYVYSFIKIFFQWINLNVASVVDFPLHIFVLNIGNKMFMSDLCIFTFMDTIIFLIFFSLDKII